MNESNEQPTTGDILEAINSFADKVEERFVGIEQRFMGVDKKFEGIDRRFDGIEQRLDRVETKLTRVESLMVTKDYLDDKLADLKGDLVLLTRKEDKKLKMLIQILEKRRLISPEEVKQIVAMEPFPEMV